MNLEFSNCLTTIEVLPATQTQPAIEAAPTTQSQLTTKAAPPAQVVLKPEPLLENEQVLHRKALALSARYRQAEADLLKIILEIDKARIFLKFNHSSTFAYCVQELKLSESTSFNFINVARKSQEVPKLMEAISNGALGVAKARKIVPVLTRQNQKIWIEKASNLTQSALEREVAEATPYIPRQAREVSKPFAGGRVRLELDLDLENLKLLRKAQDLASGKLQRSLNITETLVEVVKKYLQRNDPIERAKRKVHEKRNVVKMRKVLEKPKVLKKRKMAEKRIPISAELRHTLNLRDQWQCQAQKPNGSICRSTRYLHFHHLKPVSQGGLNSIENLITLCGSCHRRWHKQLESH